MNIIFKYYANILGLIRFLGIGVGNEDSRASSVFVTILIFFFSIILKLIGFDVLSINVFILVTIVLSVFFLVYLSFSKDSIKKKILNWLETNSLQQRVISAIFSLIFTITTIIIFLRLYA